MTDDELDRIEYEIQYQWNCLLMDHGFVTYDTYSLEDLRVDLYAVFLVMNWTTAIEVEDLIQWRDIPNIGNGNMEDLLMGLTRLGELECQLFDDSDDLHYKLSDIGLSWTHVFIPDESEDYNE